MVYSKQMKVGGIAYFNYDCREYYYRSKDSVEVALKAAHRMDVKLGQWNVEVQKYVSIEDRCIIARTPLKDLKPEALSQADLEELAEEFEGVQLNACYRQDAHECIEKHTQMPTYMEQRALIIQQNLREAEANAHLLQLDNQTVHSAVLGELSYLWADESPDEVIVRVHNASVMLIQRPELMAKVKARVKEMGAMSEASAPNQRLRRWRQLWMCGQGVSALLTVG